MQQLDPITTAYLSLQAKLKRLVGKIVKSRDVDDVLQDTYVRAFIASRKREIEFPQAYLYRTAKHVALNYIDRANQKLVDSVGDFEPPGVYIDNRACDLKAESGESFLLFCHAVRKLPPKCRRVFVLKKVYGFSQKEIASYLRISEKTVEKHVAKGLQRCLAFLAAGDYARDAGLPQRQTAGRKS